MDEEEAERLARAIRKAPVDWIRVSGVEQNPTTNTYEVKCEYKQPQKGLFHSGESWTTLLIKSPRQWIDLTFTTRQRLGTSLNTLSTGAS